MTAYLIIDNVVFRVLSDFDVELIAEGLHATEYPWSVNVAVTWADREVEKGVRRYVRINVHNAWKYLIKRWIYNFKWL